VLKGVNVPVGSFWMVAVSSAVNDSFVSPGFG